MKNISCISELREEILSLEEKQKAQGRLLQAQFNTTMEQLKPASLIQKAISDIAVIPDLKGELINTTLGLASGYFTKKLAVGNSVNPLKQLAGTLLQVAITTLVSKKADLILSVGKQLVGAIARKNTRPVPGQN